MRREEDVIVDFDGEDDDDDGKQLKGKTTPKKSFPMT